MKKKYTRRQIKEAISFWESKLGEMPESPSGGENTAPVVPEKNEKAIETAIGDEENESEQQAAKSPVGTLNMLGRMYRIHINAKNNAAKVVSKFLNSNKVPVKETGITFINSFVDDDAGKFEFKDEPMVITMKVDVDRATVKGFRKFMSVLLKEAGEEEIDEGIWGTIGAAFGAAKEKGIEKAKESIEKANEELKQKIGVYGLQEYVKRFCGPKLAKTINHNAIFDGQVTDNEVLVYQYSVAFNVERG